MRKTNFISLSAMILGLTFFSLTSCDKDKDGNGGSSDLVGTWTVNVAASDVEVTVNEFDFLEFMAELMGITLDEAKEAFLAGTLEIKSDGTYKMTSGGEVDNGTWELSSDKKTITLDKGTADEIEATVITLTSSKLVIEFSDEDNSEDWDGDEIPDNYVIFMHLELTK